MKLKLLISIRTFAFIFYLLSLPCHAQLSSDVDLGGGASKSESAKEASTKEITVTGIGITLESAEKQALASAIRQAVGAYMDSKTIVENEEVIQDRILSVSNAFVEKYEVVGQPKKSSDGLIEIIILATVKTKQVVQALKENNLISGEVAGQNLWAEASTKVMNAQDAVAMLEAKIPELIKSVVTITPLDDKGLPKMAKDSTGKEVSSTAPAKVEEDASTGEATLTWYLEIGIDKKYYADTFFPIVNKCLAAIMGCASQKIDAKLSYSQTQNQADFIGQDIFDKPLPIKQSSSPLPYLLETNKIVGSYYNSGFFLIKNVSRNFDSIEGICYPKPKNNILVESGQSFPNSNECLATLNIQLLASDGEKLASQIANSWQPFSTFGNTIGMAGPFSTCSAESLFYLKKPIVQKLKIKVPIDLIKNIKTVKLSLEVPNISVSLEKSKELNY